DRHGEARAADARLRAEGRGERQALRAELRGAELAARHPGPGEARDPQGACAPSLPAALSARPRTRRCTVNRSFVGVLLIAALLESAPAHAAGTRIVPTVAKLTSGQHTNGETAFVQENGKYYVLVAGTWTATAAAPASGSVSNATVASDAA